MGHDSGGFKKERKATKRYEPAHPRPATSAVFARFSFYPKPTPDYEVSADPEPARFRGLTPCGAASGRVLPSRATSDPDSTLINYTAFREILDRENR